MANDYPIEQEVVVGRENDSTLLTPIQPNKALKERTAGSALVVFYAE
jgi:hypothetical protein